MSDVCPYCNVDQMEVVDSILTIYRHEMAIIKKDSEIKRLRLLLKNLLDTDNCRCGNCLFCLARKEMEGV